MPLPAKAPHALLEVCVVLGDTTSRAIITWEWKAVSGAKVRSRRRYSQLPIGLKHVRHVSDDETVLVFMDALATALVDSAMPEAPAPPGGGATGGDQLTLPYAPGGIDEAVYTQING